MVKKNATNHLIEEAITSKCLLLILKNKSDDQKMIKIDANWFSSNQLITSLCSHYISFGNHSRFDVTYLSKILTTHITCTRVEIEWLFKTFTKAGNGYTWSTDT